jgi:hypothetical protein
VKPYLPEEKEKFYARENKKDNDDDQPNTADQDEDFVEPKKASSDFDIQKPQ